MSEREDKAIEEAMESVARSVASKMKNGNHGNTGTCTCNDCENAKYAVRYGWKEALAYHAKKNAEAEKRLEEAVRSLEESIVDLRGYTITRHSLSALNIFNRAERLLKQLDAVRAA